MKSQSKLTRIRLDDKHAENIIILGIVSPEPDYKLSLFINRKSGIALKSADPLIIQADGSEMPFSVFSYSDEDSETVYNLVANRSDAGLLLKNPRNIDFILTVRGEDVNAGEMIAKLRLTESVTGVFRLDPSHDRNIQYIIAL